MKVLIFKPQFAQAVLEGTKKQTVRPARKNPIKPGNELSLRQWIGLPYRSKQIILREAICKSTHAITITSDGLVTIDSESLRFVDSWLFARADGFHSNSAMVEWFEKTHGLPFSGTLITWN